MIREHVRSNAVAYVALFVALGGTAVAASGGLPGKNTVFSADIKNNQVRASDIGKGAVRSSELKAIRVRVITDPPENGDGTDPCDPPAELATFCGDFGVGWAHYGPPHAPGAFYRDNEGIVHLEGLIVPGTYAGASIFFLPPAYRPATRHVFDVQAHDLDTGYFTARVDVTAQGEVVVVGQVPNPSAQSWLPLDGISFRAGT